MAMSTIDPAEHIAILDLISRYSRTFDSGDVEAFAALFTEDASFSTPVGNASTRAGIEAWARERWDDLRRDGITPTHFQTNTVLASATLGVATGTTQLLLIWHRAATNTSEVTGVALYSDEFRKTPQGWRIHRRSIGWGGSNQGSG
jgi:ketosteroid isomerase-like protein